ncbi:YitT family protein [Paenibacillus protaetiae]|uniref:YitT family protein n=1 Tax=Paenibacillus protaetiae TaxID=2509456 RepID=A0A4P6EV70_9BACL|nr:YitT family protein [Paenibacillus protaetiae]QAY66912.1 YitT family protein [Paenibacillus protaetiae]
MAKAHKKLSFLEIVKRILFITIGAVMMGVALELFLVNNSVIDGGVTGISIMLSHLTGMSYGIFIVILNLPFLVLGFKQIGKTFVFSTLYGIVIMSITTQILHHHAPFTEEKLLAVLFGGMILGAGVGLVMRFGGSLDGTEIVAILLSKKTNMSVGQIVMIINVFIFIAAGFVFKWDSAMYSMITYYIAIKLIDIVVDGLEESKSVMIISNEYEEISDTINSRLGRSTTFIMARGGYSREETQVIYCVVTRVELAKLKSLVHDVDPRAFLSIQSVSDVHGSNFAKKDIH